MRQVIAIGGGGFGRTQNSNHIEQYILDQAQTNTPNICFIPTATGDTDPYIVNYYSVFSKLECNPTHISFFKRTIDLKEHILNQDVIFVGGGNTKSMLAVWKEWELDIILNEAYENNIIMSGVSAGAICWFKKGITDSWKDSQATIDCLGFVEGICCPHYDEEPERIPYVKKILEANEITECYGIEGYAALHLIDDKPRYNVSFKKDTSCHHIFLGNNKVHHKNINGTIEVDS
jgi:aminopeptidase N